jgi:hypothetical protein
MASLAQAIEYRIRVVDHAGRPVPGAEAVFVETIRELENNDHHEVVVARVTTDSLGEARIEHTLPRDVGPRKYIMRGYAVFGGRRMTPWWYKFRRISGSENARMAVVRSIGWP